MKTPQPIYRDISRVLVSRRRLQNRVARLGKLISTQYATGDLTILAVLTGSFIFLADLVRHLPMRMRLDVVAASSYPGTATRSHGVKFTLPLRANLRGRDVLIVDDILDSGQTLGALIDAVGLQEPHSIRTCVLLRKYRPDIRSRPEADFVGFDVADLFVVGYGLDNDGLYRNLPDICVLKTHDGRERSKGRS